MSNLIDVEGLVWRHIREYRAAPRLIAKSIAMFRLPQIRNHIKNPALLRAVDEILKEDARLRVEELSERLNEGIEDFEEPLEQIFSGNRQGYLEEQVSNAKPVRIFFCIKGRNAWHATWVRRYTNSCIFGSLRAAKNFCEAQRGQGNVFYILALPALRINTERGSLILTEINDNTPLHRVFNYVAFMMSLSIKKKPLDILDAFYDIAEEVGGDVEHLLALRIDRSAYLEPVDEDRSDFPGWRSVAVGAECLLDWQIFDRECDASAVLELASVFDDRGDLT